MVMAAAFSCVCVCVCVCVWRSVWRGMLDVAEHQ